MDLSAVKTALESKSYDKIADICDNLMLQVAADGVAFHDEWPYSVHLLAHFYVHDINSARFLWKTIPSSIKESNPEVNAVWKIGQQLWLRNYGGVHEAVRGFEWSPELQCFISAFSELYTKEIFQLLVSAYSTISVEDAALFLGMSDDGATSYVLQQGWTVDNASRMLTVKKQPVVSVQKLDPCKLQQLTEYVFHLEH
ncbi:COP9 signalosome complex subunit 8 [Medicago truncatula]|uniref:COP9 signalosome complex subunit 8 n=1 Tax=Medicago truncatula TaxID=3880 RepID=G7IL66_MEDTR|nr:COP9 signalosome complex subunit 8 [Medicago truncatula]XP_024633000.1 COP9 signalosome complex subunit 8 [Medicago truncatula]AES63354.1 COP9 signalosome complex subunit 8 [Medicago truncatula]AFK36275.1 unknown [Medicago truncatula]AFK38111.1 unknown [Medicago truncatula]